MSSRLNLLTRLPQALPSRVCLLAALLMLPLASASPLAQADHASSHVSPDTLHRVTLRVDAPVAGLGRDWPLFCGVPIGKGELTDIADARLVDAAGQPIPAQFKVMSHWPGTASIRWLGVHFQADPAGEYFLEYQPGSQLAGAAADTFVTPTDQGYIIDTGPARFVVPHTGPLIQAAYLDPAGQGRFTDRQRVIHNQAGDDLFVIDRHGRQATIGRDDQPGQLTIEPSLAHIQQHGAPLQVTLRREGWYVTEDGQRVARHITRLYFHRHHAFVRIEHTLVLTEDSETMWLRDVGLRFTHGLTLPQQVRFAPPSRGPEGRFAAELFADDQAIALLQDKGPYFHRTDLDQHARYTIASQQADQNWQTLTQGSLAGDWISVQNDQAGITLTLRELWQQFPKELQADSQALTALLWSSRGQGDMDLRKQAYLERLPREWLDYFTRSQYHRWLHERPIANAQGIARTHELLLHLHPPGQDETIQQTAAGFSKPATVLADPQQLYQSQAMGPIYPYAPHQFPLAEGFSRAWFDQFTAVANQWGNFGFFDYGAGPHVWYFRPSDGPLAGRWIPHLERNSGMLTYGFHGHLWRMYARSGDRRYLDLAETINRHRMDLSMVHWGPDADYATRHGWLIGKYRGAIHGGSTAGPIYWTDRPVLHHGSGTDIRNLFWFYYLRDYRRARDVADAYHQLVRQFQAHGATGPFSGTRPFATLKNLATLYQETGDPKIYELARSRAEALADLDSPQGVTGKLVGGMGKYGTKISAFERWYEATGDELARDVVLRGATTYARTSMGNIPLSYYNAFARVLNRAYRITGDPLFARTLKRNMQLAIASYHDPQTGQWRDMLGNHPSAANNVYPMGDLAISMDAIVRAGDSLGPAPMLQQTGHGQPVVAVVRKSPSKAVTLDIRGRYPLTPTVYTLDGQPVQQAVITPYTEQLYSLEPVARPRFFTIDLPAELPAGDYVISAGADHTPWELHWTDADHAVLYAPAGLSDGAGSTWRGQFSPGGTPEAAPLRWHFRVPSDVDTFMVYHNGDLTLRNADGQATDPIAPHTWTSIAVPSQQAGRLWRFAMQGRGFVQLRGLPMVLASDPTKHLDLNISQINHRALGLLTDDPQADDFELPDDLFTTGAIDSQQPGQGLVITGRRAVRLPRGQPLGDGSYEHFDPRQGTLEFWFKPNWSSMHAVGPGNSDRYVLHAEGWMIRLQYNNQPQNIVQLFGSPERLTHTTGLNLNKGQWVHLAWQWYLDDAGHTVVDCYINGQRDNVGHPHTISETRSKAPNWQPRSPGEWLTFGRHHTSSIRPLQGVVDQLRLSNIRRYDRDFAPDRTRPLQADAHTLMYFPFDGDAVGIGPAGQTIQAQIQP